MNINITMIAEIQNGLVTHHQLQFITLHNFRIINAKPNKQEKLYPFAYF